MCPATGTGRRAGPLPQAAGRGATMAGAGGFGGSAAAPQEEEEEEGWRDWRGGVPADVLRLIVAKLADTARAGFAQSYAVRARRPYQNVFAAVAPQRQRCSAGAESRPELSWLPERPHAALYTLYAFGSVCKEWQALLQRQALGGQPLCVWALKNLKNLGLLEPEPFWGKGVLLEVVNDAASLGAPHEVWDFLFSPSGPRCRIGRELNAQTCALAAAGGHLETLQRLRAEGCPWDTRTCDAAIERGRVEVLRWALETGCPLQRQKGTLVAARKGDVKVLAVLRSFDCPLDRRTCAAAAGGGNLELVRWLRAQGCPWDSDSVRAAERHGHPNVLLWLRENGCPEHQDRYSVDARYGSGG